MSLSTQQNADLSKHAYDTSVRPGIRPAGTKDYVEINGITYNILEHYNNPKTGYQGTIYQRTDTGDIAVAHRGTEVTEGMGTLFRDAGIVDGSMVVRRVNPQAQEAVELTRRAINRANDIGKDPQSVIPQVTTTGHSLGGCLAQITAHHFGLKGETFNAYGAASLGLGVPKGGHDVMNHVMATDFVSAASPHYGQIRIYASPKEVAALVGAGYENNDRFVADVRSPGPVHLAMTVMHSMHHFTNADGDGRPDRSILADPNARQRAEQYAPMFEKFRDEVALLRSATTTVSTRLTPALVGFDSDGDLPIEPAGVRGQREGAVLKETVVIPRLPDYLREGDAEPATPTQRPAAPAARQPDAINGVERVVIPPIPDYLRDAARTQSSVTPDVEVRSTEPLTEWQREVRDQALREANRLGLPSEGVQQVAAREAVAVSAGFSPVREPPKDLRDSNHPGHQWYAASLDSVRRMEARNGIDAGPHSERLAAAVAIAVERDQLKVQRLDLDKTTGQVTVIERGPYPNFDERRVPIDTRQALGQSFEQSSQQWLEARSPHYATDAPKAERSREQSEALAQLTPADQAMFAKIRENVPASVSDDHVAQVALAAKRDGIHDASKINQVAMVGDKLWVEGTTPGYRAAVDVSQQVPQLQETAQQSQTFNQQRDLQLAQEAQQRSQSDPGQGPKLV
jgi:hypothetical protein